MVRFNEKYGSLSIRICPACDRAFYARIDGSLICRHCGYAFMERRDSERIGSDVDFIILIKGRKISAKLKDYSERGARIVYKDGGGTYIHAYVDIYIREFHIHRKARAVWTRKLPGSYISAGFAMLKNKS